jgi:transposase
MDILYPHCCGIDVHKKSVMACVNTPDPNGATRSEVRRFGTTTRELLELADWLRAHGVEQVAMESTGVYWKPVWNLLEDEFSLILVNAQHVKNVPGRKTDVQDCVWLAKLLQHGLLRGSFVPARPIRELRELCRYRTSLVAERSAASNRIQKTLEDADIKLSSVVSDILGVSSRRILARLAAGDEDVEALAEGVAPQMRKKIPQLREALWGGMREHHRFLLRQQLAHVERLEHEIADLEGEIGRRTEGYEPQVRLLEAAPGIDRTAARSLLAEIGPDMSVFPSDRHLTSWAAICPGNYESAGKRMGGKPRKGNRWLKALLTQIAWAASRTKNTFWSAKYRRLAARRGKKRAIVALANALLRMIYHLLKTGNPYRDLGAAYYDRLQKQTLTRKLVLRLEALGHSVSLQPVGA